MKQGFTLIELLVVVLVIGILSAVALPQYQTAVERARATEALTQMSAVRSSLERYHAQHEAWPDSDNPNTRFNMLDVDIPEAPAVDGVAACVSGRGSKNFCLTFERNSGVIRATRRRTNGAYTLTTTITPNANNGTYTAVRSCTPGEDADSRAYCNAITGGHNEDF